MELYKKVRKSKGWKRYKMAKELRITQTQLKHYEDQPISTRELLLVRLQKVSGASDAEMWSAIKAEAEKYEDFLVVEEIENLKKKRTK